MLQDYTRRFFLGALLLALCTPVRAQTGTYAFKRISLEEGLSQSTVYAIAQDRMGFLWFGTQDGLNRYDGYRFTPFHHDAADTTTLPANWVLALHADAGGRLWVGTNGGGLARLDPGADRFTRYRHAAADPHSLPHDIVSALHVDGAGVVWAATYGGLARLDPDTGQFATYAPQDGVPGGLRSARVLSLAEDTEGRLWVGTDRGGLARLDPDTGQFATYLPGPDAAAGPGDSIILTLHAGRRGILWAGTARGGLSRFDPESGRFTHYRHDGADPHSLPHDRVLALREDAGGALWVGTEGGGLARLTPESGRFIHYRHDGGDPHSLSSNVVTALFTDRSGTLWAGTAGAGLNKKSRFLHVRAGAPEGLPNSNVLAVYEGHDAALWLGTQGGGLARLAPADGAGPDHRPGSVTTFRHDVADTGSLAHDRVLALQEDAGGALWIATGDGLDRLPPGGARFEHFRHDPADPNSLSENRVITLYTAPSDGALWVGTWGGGLDRLPAGGARFEHFRHAPADPGSLSNNRVIALFEDRAGHLWVGTLGGGLNRRDPATGRFTRYRHDPADPRSLSNDIVASIYEDAAGRLWVGTGEGLNRFEPSPSSPGGFTRYTQRDGLPNNTVYGILEDDAGWLWLSTNKGLSALAPDRGAFVNYDLGDGLQSNEFNQGAYHRGRSGALYFGGINGLNRFHPADLRTPPPPIVLTALSLGRAEAEAHPSADGETITLLREDAFSFEFAALDFVNPARSRYAYKLDGFDADWHERGAGRRYATYANLKGGTYTLRVRGSNGAGVWNDDGLAVTIRVVPPFWQTTWFRLLAVLAVLGTLGGGAYGWHRVRIRHVEQMRDERAEIQRRLTESREAERLHLAQELHDGAVQDLYGVQFQFGGFADDLPDSGRRALAQGQTTVQDVIRQLREICGTLRPPTLAPFGLERAIRAHAERFQEAHPTITVALDLAEDGQQLPEPTRLALYRVYQEAMNNIVKHAEAAHVEVRLTLDAAHVRLAIRDDGGGFVLPARWIELGRREHYGLLGIAERAEALGGRLDVTSAPGQGTTVSVTAPRPAEPHAPPGLP